MGGPQSIIDKKILPPLMVSPQVEKLFNALIRAGAVSEDKAVSAEKATSLSKLPKAQCMNAVQELKKLGALKDKKNNNSVSYFLVRTSL